MAERLQAAWERVQQDEYEREILERERLEAALLRVELRKAGKTPQSYPTWDDVQAEQTEDTGPSLGDLIKAANPPHENS